jgi:TolB protein
MVVNLSHYCLWKDVVLPDWAGYIIDFLMALDCLCGGRLRVDSQALEWAVLGSDVVLSVRIRTKSESSLEISARLYDTHSGKEVLEITKKGPATDVRILGHAISDDVVKYFTGQSGIFSSKLVFVNDVTGRKELYSADYDGKGLKRLTNDNSIVILPRISPNGQKIIFTSYISGNPDLYIMNRDGSGRKKMSAKAGLNVSPSWSPNNSEIALTLSMGGQPNIYLVDLSGQIKQQLTDSRGADTAPSFSPDGTQISFTSDRAGNPQIYVVNIDGSGLRRLTTAPHCDSSAWSTLRPRPST